MPPGPTTGQMPDAEYHPLDPRAAMPTTPLDRLNVQGVTPHTTTFWSDFKAATGLDRSMMSSRERVIAEAQATEAMAERGIVGGAATGRAALMALSYGAGGFLTGGGMFAALAAGTALDVGAGTMWRASGLGGLKEHFEGKAFAESIGQVVARGSGATLSGHGFSSDEASELSQFFGDAADRFNVSIEDIKGDVVEYVNQGLMTGTHEVEDFKRKFAQLKENVKEIVEVLGTTQEEAVEMLGQFNRQGISSATGVQGIQTAERLSRRTGLPTSQFLQSGLTTAQSFQGTGLSANAGYLLGMSNQAAVTEGLQTGRINQGAVWQMGGPDRAAFAMTQMQTNFLNTPQGQLLLRSATGPGGEFDPTQLVEMSQAGLHEQLSRAQEQMRGGGYLRFLGTENEQKSAFLGQGADYVNTNMFRSLIQRAQASGLDVSSMDLSQLKGFAIATGQYNAEQFDVMAGAVHAAGTRQTAMGQERERRARLGEIEAYNKRGGPLRQVGRTLGYEAGRIAGAVAEPFEAMSDNLTRAADNTVDRFSDWVEKKKYGTVNFEMHEEDLRMLVNTAGQGDLASLGMQDLRRGMYEDLSWSGADAPETVKELMRREVLTEENAGIQRLSEMYYSEEAQQKIEEAGLKAVPDIPGGGAQSRRLKQLQQIYPELTGFKNKRFLTTDETFVTKDPEKFFNQIETLNTQAQMAKTWGSKTPEERTGELQDTIAGEDLYRIQNRLERFRKDPKMKRRFATASEDRKIQMLIEQGFDSEVQMEEMSQQDVENVLTLGANVGLGVDPDEVKQISIGSNVAQLEEALETQKKNVSGFLDQMEMSTKPMYNALGQPVGRVAVEGTELSGETREYLGSAEGRALLDKWYGAVEDVKKAESMSPGAGGASRAKNKLGKIYNEIIDEASPEAKEELVEALSENRDTTYKALQGYFGAGEGGVSQYQQDIQGTVGAEVFRRSLTGLKSAKDKEVRAFARQSREEMAGALKEGRGVNIESLLRELPSTSAQAARYGDMNKRERRAAMSRLIDSGSSIDQLSAFAAMGEEQFQGLKDNMREGFRDNVISAIAGTGLAKREDLEGLSHEDLRLQALRITGIMGQQERAVAGGVNVEDAQTRSQVALNKQLTTALQEVTIVLQQLTEGDSQISGMFQGGVLGGRE